MTDDCGCVTLHLCIYGVIYLHICIYFSQQYQTGTNHHRTLEYTCSIKLERWWYVDHFMSCLNIFPYNNVTHCYYYRSQDASWQCNLQMLYYLMIYFYPACLPAITHLLINEMTSLPLCFHPLTRRNSNHFFKFFTYLTYERKHQDPPSFDAQARRNEIVCIYLFFRHNLTPNPVLLPTTPLM